MRCFFHGKRRKNTSNLITHENVDERSWEQHHGYYKLWIGNWTAKQGSCFAFTWVIFYRTPPLQFPDTRSSIEIRYGEFFGYLKTDFILVISCLLPPWTEYRLHNVYGVPRPCSYYTMFITCSMQFNISVSKSPYYNHIAKQRRRYWKSIHWCFNRWLHTQCQQ